MKSFVQAAILLILALPAVVNAAACPAGSSSGNGQTPCTQCTPGKFQPNTGQTSCNTAQAGYSAPGSGNTAQTPCGPGSYSNQSGQASCTTCPAGKQCTNAANTTPQVCSPGTFQANEGSKVACADCPAGYFNSVQGAKDCCQCCSGYYNSSPRQTNCQRCSDQPNTGGPIGSTSSGNCRRSDGTEPNTCQMNGNFCPRTTNTGPSPSKGITRRDISTRCGRGYKRCPVAAGAGTLTGYDCVDVANDLESCGGCVSNDDAKADGQDCSAIEKVNNVKCSRGKCLILSCMHGYRISDDGKFCQSSLIADKRSRATHA